MGYFKEQVRVASERGEVVARNTPGKPVRYPLTKAAKSIRCWSLRPAPLRDNANSEVWL